MRKIDLDLVGTSQATTYRFRERGELPAWACCTVNDETGELTVQSDWGTWAYRWSSNPKHLGAPTLTHFIAGCNDVDYIARKLNHEGTQEEVFSPELTANEIKKLILERRRDDANRYGVECHRLSSWTRAAGCGPRGLDLPLSRDAARELWRLLDRLVEDLGPTAHSIAAGRECAALFFERMPSEIYDYWDDVHELARGAMRPECLVLREAILPALFAACKAEIARREVPCRGCGGSGVIETGNNDIPCDCPAGDVAIFNVAGRGRVTGRELKAGAR